jgi:hypothetical protein
MVIKDRTLWLVILGGLGLYGVTAFHDWWHARTIRLLGEEVLRPLRAPHRNEEGYWVGDITENYRLGKISRELAEADTAPLNPLVPKPVPLHGYFVRVMDSGPSFENDTPPVSLKGMKRCRDNFAILFYPAEHGPGKSSFIHSALGVHQREDDWVPTFSYPTDQERIAHWGIVD